MSFFKKSRPASGKLGGKKGKGKKGSSGPMVGSGVPQIITGKPQVNHRVTKVTNRGKR